MKATGKSASTGEGTSAGKSASVCVFCGAKNGADPAYAELAFDLGRTLATHGYTTVYGGGRVGLMGALSRGAREAGGRVIGVIPERLVQAEVADTEITTLEVVSGMAVRKERMIELSDAFVALPGGLGTLDELFEVMTLAQIGYHAKPIYLLNQAGVFDDLLRLGQSLQRHGFVLEPHWQALRVVESLEALLAGLHESVGPAAH